MFRHMLLLCSPIHIKCIGPSYKFCWTSHTHGSHVQSYLSKQSRAVHTLLHSGTHFHEKALGFVLQINQPHTLETPATDEQWLHLDMQMYLGTVEHEDRPRKAECQVARVDNDYYG